MSDDDKIKITWDDVDKARPRPPATSRPSSSSASKSKSYGNVGTSHSISSGTSGISGGSSLFLQGWVYLGIGGVLGALLGWAGFESSFLDSDELFRWWQQRYTLEEFNRLSPGDIAIPIGNQAMGIAVITLMCIGYAIAESVVERSLPKALTRGGIALVVGLVLGYVMDKVGDEVYARLLEAFETEQKPDDVSGWLARGIAWITYGVAAGIVYGIAGQSPKKCLYGCIGGAIGAFMGGLLFNPIQIAVGGAEASRAFGFGLVGLATGIAMGLVESALKDRWLYVTGGPLAGKQFILYKDRTVLGSKPKCDLYLFKDSEILPEHAVFEIRGGVVHLATAGPVTVSGQPFAGGSLRNGDVLQIGRYSFEYREKVKARIN